MTGKQTYWISDTSGVHAQVEGTEQRDQWTKVQGWSETAEPGPTDQVHVIHESGGRGQLPFGAVAGGWDGLGWSIAPPPEPVDLTKDPQLVDQSPAAASAEPTKQTSAPASGTASKEK